MMKNNIDELMKKALEGLDLPYEDGAWESFQKKMDVKKASRSYKWWFTSAAAILAVISTIILWNNSESKLHSASKSTERKNQTNSSQNKFTNANKDSNTSNKRRKSIHLDQAIISEKETTLDENSSNSTNVIDESAIVFGFQKIKSQELIQTKQDLSKEEITQLPQVNGSNEPNFPTFGNKCKGEKINIENSGINPIVFKSPSGIENVVEINSKEEIALKEAGLYQVGFYDPKLHENFRETSTFKVFNSPVINLNVEDALTYENGLPTIKAEANTNEDNVFWKIEIQGKSGYSVKPKSNELTFFKKGNYDVSVKVSNELGCESKDSKSVYIAEDYNLLAVNAFNPNSTDIRNNTFIPFALTVRNTPFKMIIIDPDNGGVIFETSDSSNPWDGIDRRDGKMVNPNKAYIWKVSLFKPEPNEKADYRGTIIRIP